MTKHQQESEAINKAAEDAARAALDAFANDANGKLPTAAEAWEFLNSQVYAEGGRPAHLPDAMPRQFKHDYRRWLRTLEADYDEAPDADSDDVERITYMDGPPSPRVERARNRRARLEEGRADAIISHIRALAEELKGTSERATGVNILCVLQDRDDRRNGKD